MTTPGLRVDQVAEAFVSVPGVAITMLDEDTGADTTTSATFEDCGTASESFVVPVAGLYLVRLTIDGFATSNTAGGRYQLVFDAAGTPQYVGPDNQGWEMATSASPASRPYKTMFATVALTAGAHTVKVQWKRSFGTGTWNVDTYSHATVIGELVSGSGAGGVIVTPATPSSNPTTINNLSYTDIPGLSFSIVTAADEDVQLNFKGNAYAPSGASNAYVQWYIDGVALDAPASSTSPATLTSIDMSFSRTHKFTTGGSHTITIQGKYLTNVWHLYDCHASIVQYRGGIVPQETKSPKGTWATTTTVSFGPRPGQPATVRLTLQDGIQRYMTTGTWDVANGVADWGYDEAASQGNSKWLYFYAVPKSGDDTQLVIRVSDNDPSTGPTGYTNWKLCWSTYMESGATLRKVYQNGSKFELSVPTIGFDFTGSGSADASVQTLTLTNHIPASAQAVDLLAYYQANGTGSLWVFVYGDEVMTSDTTRWDSSKLKASSPDTNGGQCARELVPTPGSTKRVTYARAAYLNSRIEVQGWIDEWIDS